MSFNKFIGVGNIVRNPEVRTVGQSQVASFSVAINERFRKQDGSTGESTLFLDCEYWNIGGVLTYLTQGTQVLVEGSLRMDSWTDQNGQRRDRMKLRIATLTLTGSRPQTQQSYAPPQQQPQSYYPQQPQAPQYGQPTPPPSRPTRQTPPPPPPMPKDDPDMPF